MKYNKVLLMFTLYCVHFITLFSSSLQAVIDIEVQESIRDPKELSRTILKEKENPQIVIWYGGESGVNKEGAEFYKEQIFNEFNKQDKPFKFYLYDLIAWGGLRNLKASIKSKDKLADQVKKERFSFIHSADFLDDLVQEKDPDVVQYYNETILKNPALAAPSNGRKPNHIKVRDVLPAGSLKTIHEVDTAYAYSPLQYLEGIYLAKRILQNSGQKPEIIFMLPNDEYKYYTSATLKDDLNKVLKKDANINFVNFRYGDEIYKRPYISKSKKVNKAEIESYLE